MADDPKKSSPKEEESKTIDSTGNDVAPAADTTVPVATVEVDKADKDGTAEPMATEVPKAKADAEAPPAVVRVPHGPPVEEVEVEEHKGGSDDEDGGIGASASKRRFFPRVKHLLTREWEYVSVQDGHIFGRNRLEITFLSL